MSSWSENQPQPVWLAVIHVGALILLLAVYFLASKRARARRAHYSAVYEELSNGAADNLLADSRGLREKQSKSKLFTYADVGGQLLKYDVDKTTSWQVLFHLGGTVAAHPAVLWHVTLYYAVAFLAFGVEQLIVRCDLGIPLLRLVSLSAVSQYFTSFIGILLGFYISTVMGRWWSIRNDTLGSLWGAVDDLCLLMGAHFPGKDWRDVRTLVLRYSLASFELIFMQAQGTDSELWRLEKRKLLTADEVAKLQDTPSRPQAIWTWVAWIFHELHEQGHVSDIMLQLFYSKCTQARGGIGGILAYLTTQLPWAYVHLLACMVHLMCTIVAIDVGLSNSRYVTAFVDPDDAPEHGPLVKMIQLVLTTFFYTGCMELGRALTDPLGNDFEDFPRHAYVYWMWQEAEAFHSTNEEPVLACQETVKRMALRQQEQTEQKEQKELKEQKEQEMLNSLEALAVDGVQLHLQL